MQEAGNNAKLSVVSHDQYLDHLEQSVANAKAMLLMKINQKLSITHLCIR
jgi:hypothetical protein